MTTLIEFLSASDTLSTKFKQSKNSINLTIQSIQSSKKQQSNLDALPAQSKLKIAGIKRIQIVIEESIESIVIDLNKMKLSIQSLESLLNEAESESNNPNSSLSNSLNPIQVISQISNLHHVYLQQFTQSELLFTQFRSAVISLEEFSNEIHKLNENLDSETELTELVDIMEQWGQTTNLD